MPNAEFTGAPILRVQWNDVLYRLCFLLPQIRKRGRNPLFLVNV